MLRKIINHTLSSCYDALLSKNIVWFLGVHVRVKTSFQEDVRPSRVSKLSNLSAGRFVVLKAYQNGGKECISIVLTDFLVVQKFLNYFFKNLYNLSTSLRVREGATRLGEWDISSCVLTEAANATGPCTCHRPILLARAS